jgi:hypothetical protein
LELDSHPVVGAVTLAGIAPDPEMADAVPAAMRAYIIRSLRQGR